MNDPGLQKNSGQNDLAVQQHLREQVSATTLVLNDLGILGYSGHVSARLPGGDTFLIQSFDQSRAELRPEHLLICDMDGHMLSGPPGQRPPAEVFIHSEIYRVRSDVEAVAHFHDDRATSFTLTEDVALVPVKNHAFRWADGIPVLNDPNHVNTPERGRAVAKALGRCHALQIRAHGQVITAESLPGLLIDSVHFVENAQAMFDASLLGKVRPLTAEEMESFSKDLKRDKHLPKLWTYYIGRAKSRGVLGPECGV